MTPGKILSPLNLVVKLPLTSVVTGYPPAWVFTMAPAIVCGSVWEVVTPIALSKSLKKERGGGSEGEADV